ncbi:MAG: hypothetical protein E6J79_04295 [Deltaproteobacteria bacterium]|nr:MAG: hypothetical protein E6J79_04295 [Deltaproteobacteria bacterium]
MAMPEEEIRRIERVRIAASPIVPAAIDVARVSWGGVWSGFCVGLGILVLLGALGMAVGTTMVGPGLADPQAFGTRAGLWTIASALIALFTGGVVASRMGTAVTRGAGAIHGMLVWVLALGSILAVAAAGFSTGAGSGLFAGTNMRAVAGDLSSLATGEPDEIVARLDDPRTADVVVSATGMPREEARAELAAISFRVRAARNDPGRARAEARAGLEEIASRAATRAEPFVRMASWAVFAGLVVSLIAALLGGTAGARPFPLRVPV